MSKPINRIKKERSDNMTAFKLPDLGEGLQDADLVEWLVAEGQHVKLDELVLLVETAKAVVELPAPSEGTITRLAAKEGDTVKVGQILFEYQEGLVFDKNRPQTVPDTESHSKRESVSVVGELNQTSDDKQNLYETENIGLPNPLVETELEKTLINQGSYKKVQPVCINSFKEAKQNKRKTIPNKTPKSSSSEFLSNKASPATIAFAKKLGIHEILDQTLYGELSLQDILKIYTERLSSNNEQIANNKDCFTLKGSRKVMAETMTKSHQLIPAATIFDDADISHWTDKEDITARIVRAISVACKQVEILNAWFDEETMAVQKHKTVNLGLAVNSSAGLYVPVIHNVDNQSDQEIRQNIQNYKDQIQAHRIKAEDLKDATISLTNFGALRGRYATPIVVPPQVCIVGTGKITEEALVKKGKIQVGKILPLSLSFDHRVATGAEAAEFLYCMIDALES